MADETQQITVLLDLGEEASDEELNSSTTQLYKALLKTDVDSIEKKRMEGNLRGARSGADALMLGAVLLDLGIATLPSVIESIYDWLKRRRSNDTTISVQIGDRSMEIPVSTKMSVEEYIATAEQMMAALEPKTVDQNTEENADSDESE